MNIVANPDFINISQDSATFRKEHEIFSSSATVHEGNSIDIYISLDRIMFLDTSPLISNIQRRDMMVAESDDIKTLVILLQICHLVLVIHDGFPDLSIARLLSVAEHMVPHEMKHRPVFASIGNRIQPGTKIMELDSRILDDTSLLIPDLNHHGISLHHDIHEIIQNLQEKIFMMKRWSMIGSDDEVFTERKWFQRLVHVVEQLKNDYFLRKYEILRDKFHQPVENC